MPPQKSMPNVKQNGQKKSCAPTKSNVPSAHCRLPLETILATPLLMPCHNTTCQSKQNRRAKKKVHSDWGGAMRRWQGAVAHPLLLLYIFFACQLSELSFGGGGGLAQHHGILPPITKHPGAPAPLHPDNQQTGMRKYAAPGCCTRHHRIVPSLLFYK